MISSYSKEFSAAALGLRECVKQDGVNYNIYVGQTDIMTNSGVNLVIAQLVITQSRGHRVDGVSAGHHG